jgi:hypothetical protein
VEGSVTKIDCVVYFLCFQLQSFYQWAQDAALSVTSKIIESHSSVPEVKVCNATLRLMHQILNWEFPYSKGGTRASINVFSDGIRPDNALSRKTECVIVQPGASWCDVLLSSSHVGWLINFYSSVRQKFDLEGYWLDCPVAVSARKLIVQLCSLAGEIFPSNNVQMRDQHLLLLLTGVLPWIDPPDVISKEIEEGRSGSEMIDGCRALLSIGTVTTPVVFDQLLRSLRPFGTLTLLSMLMGEVVKVLMANSTDEETWSYEARDILLDTWTTLLTVSIVKIYFTTAASIHNIMNHCVYETVPYLALWGYFGHFLCDCQGIYKDRSLSLPTNFL